ncbi:hypothetical protein GCM10022420_094320 [Streptomyces iranensis]
MCAGQLRAQRHPILRDGLEIRDEDLIDRPFVYQFPRYGLPVPDSTCSHEESFSEYDTLGT